MHLYIIKKPTVAKAMVGEVGAARFELATSWSQTRRDNRATLRPAKLGCKNKGRNVHFKTNYTRSQAPTTKNIH